MDPSKSALQRLMSDAKKASRMEDGEELEEGEAPPSTLLIAIGMEPKQQEDDEEEEEAEQTFA